MQATAAICLAEVLEQDRRPRAAPNLDQLTDRERQVLLLVARGLFNAAIARQLAIGETTVKTHVTRILTKLALRDRAHAVIYGYETGLIRPGDGTDPQSWRAGTG